MKFALPLGLLGLIAIAALILIYILKPKYQDKKVSSTYVWKLSLRYQKRKVPLQWLKSSLLLVVQIIIIIVMAFMMAQPLVVLATKTGEKIVVLEASASMLAEDGGKSRFDRAVTEIGSLAEKTAVEGDKFTVILAGEEASFVVRRSDSASYIKQKLSEAKCTFASSDVEEAMSLAEEVLKENPQADVYLYTDCDYADAGKVTVVNMARSEWNAAVLDFSAKREKGRYIFTAKVASYGRSAEIAVNLNVDGKARLPKLAQCEADETVSVVWDALDINEYDSADVHLVADDSFVYDNEFYIYRANTSKFKVQLDSVDPGFLYSALHSVERCQVDLVTKPEQDTEETKDPAPAKTSGYDLYIYDGTYPEKIPTDGTVWLINPPRDLPVSKWGISFNGTRSGNYALTADNVSGETYKKIMNGVSVSSMKATEYSRAVSYAGYESILKCNGDPVLLARDIGGVKTVVLAFDLHMSTLPVLLVDFPLLINNLCSYSMAHTVDNTLYNVGDLVTVNTKADAEIVSISAKYASGEEEKTDYTEFPVVLDATQAGAFTVTQTLASGRVVEDSYFVRLPENESLFNFTGDMLVNPIVISSVGTDTEIENDTMDIYVYFAAVLLALVCVEWGLQYREQY